MILVKRHKNKTTTKKWRRLSAWWVSLSNSHKSRTRTTHSHSASTPETVMIYFILLSLSVLALYMSFLFHSALVQMDGRVAFFSSFRLPFTNFRGDKLTACVSLERGGLAVPANRAMPFERQIPLSGWQWQQFLIQLLCLRTPNFLPSPEWKRSPPWKQFKIKLSNRDFSFSC